MATTQSNRYLIEIIVEQQSRHSILPTGRPTINTNTIDIHIRIFGSRRFNPSDTVWKTGIFQILPANIVESFRTVGCTHSVNLYNNKSQFSQSGTKMIGRTEVFLDVRIMRPGINHLDNRIRTGSIEGRRTNDLAPNIRLTIAAFGMENFRQLPAVFNQGTYITLFQRNHNRPIRCLAQYRNIRHISP